MLRTIVIAVFLLASNISYAALTITGAFDVLTRAKFEELDINGATIGQGTITSSGTAVTGVGTDFGNQVVPGHLLLVGSGRRMVKSITSATSLTLDTAFAVDVLVSSVYQFGRQMHFRGRIDPATGEPAEYTDPLTQTGTGITAFSRILKQAATHGWPLIGAYISSSGGSTRGTAHLAIHRSELPAQTGGPSGRADKLTTEMDAALTFQFRVVTTPTTDDPDCVPDGQGGCQEIELRPNFHVKWHTWDTTSVRGNDVNTYVTRVPGAGDYRFGLFVDQPPATWWRDFN